MLSLALPGQIANAVPLPTVCVTDEEADAFAARVALSRLMVAALSCGAAPAYNSAILRHQADLKRSGALLRGYFSRTLGHAAPRALNGYVTRLANAASALSNRDRGTYCARADAALHLLTGTREARFASPAILQVLAGHNRGEVALRGLTPTRCELAAAK